MCSTMKRIFSLRSCFTRHTDFATHSPKYLSSKARSPWCKDNSVVSPYNDVHVPDLNLWEYTWTNLEKWSGKTAMVCGVTGRYYTYEQIYRMSSKFAASLRKKLWIKEQDTVAVILPNVPEYAVVVLGIVRAGATVTSVNPVYTAHEIQRQLILSNAKVVVTLSEVTETVKNAIKLAQIDLPIVVVRTNNTEATPTGTILFNELAEDSNIDESCLREVISKPDDIVFLPYSSGTTGLPKGVELSHRNIIANSEQISNPLVRTFEDTTSTHQDAVMTVLPLFHIYAISVLMFHRLNNGGKLVTLPKFAPETFFQVLEKYKTNIIFTAPPLVILLATHNNSTPRVLRYIDRVINGAAPLAASDVERLMARVKRDFDFRQGYGLTETSPVVALTSKGMKDYGSVGKALPSTMLKIVDLNLNSLGPNEKGELLVKGPQVMRGYKDNPKANAEVFTEDGWFRTGDLAVIDENGVTTIADRLKELIKVKGFQVPPAELEGILRQHPSVADAAVVGIPHPVDGESPKAFVVVVQGHKVTESELQEFVRDKVAPYKRIKNIAFIENIPKNASGKILRRELKEKLC